LYGIAWKRKEKRTKRGNGQRQRNSAVQAGRTQFCTSPTPKGKLPPEFAPSLHPCRRPPSLPPLFSLSSWRSVTGSTTAASVMVRGSSKTVVKRSRDEALEHVKLALRTNSCLFTKQEMSFIRTSCQILGLRRQCHGKGSPERGQGQRNEAAKESDGSICKVD
jgi:hypothetical protein